jgi:anti-anti-sigma regulatory factor
MLKITSIEGQKRNRVVVEGRLDAPLENRAESACEKAQANLHGRELIVQLKHLTAISQEGENMMRFVCKILMP